MTSVQDLKQQIAAYLRGTSSLEALEERVASCAEEAASSEDDEFRRLHNSVWLEIGEFDAGVVSEFALTCSLTALLSPNQLLTWEGWTSAPTVATGAVIELPVPPVSSSWSPTNMSQTAPSQSASLAESPWALEGV